MYFQWNGSDDENLYFSVKAKEREMPAVLPGAGAEAWLGFGGILDERTIRHPAVAADKNKMTNSHLGDLDAGKHRISSVWSAVCPGLQGSD